MFIGLFRYTPVFTQKGKIVHIYCCVIAVPTESNNPQVYWRVVKKSLSEERNETVTNCNRLKKEATDGKMRLTDVVDLETFEANKKIANPCNLKYR